VHPPTELLHAGSSNATFTESEIWYQFGFGVLGVGGNPVKRRAVAASIARSQAGAQEARQVGTTYMFWCSSVSSAKVMQRCVGLDFIKEEGEPI
jgi:hypothetical protein